MNLIASSPERVNALRAGLSARTTQWGWLPLLSLIAASGLCAIAMANRFSYEKIGWAQVLFWVGLLLLFVPIAARLASVEPTREERLGLLLVLGLSVYFIKLMHSPFAFTFSDERLHLYNANAILDSHHLFQANSMLPVSAFYPGLENVTTALSNVAGLSVFDSGRIVIGLARLLLVCALFLAYERLLDSARIAGLATLLYMANSNYLYWSAQFSYESLALPLAVLVLFAVLRWEKTREPNLTIGLRILILVTMTAIVITHHLTSYLLIVYLALLSFAGLVVARDKQRNPGFFALFGLVAALSWLIFVSSLTLPYLYQIFSRAFVSIPAMLTGELGGRELFRAGSGAVAPLWERIVGVASIFLLVLGTPFGLIQIWRWRRNHATVLVLSAAALTYFAILGLRVVPAGWEVANRASEFLYLGVGLVFAVGWGELYSSKRANRIMRAALVGAIAVIFTGGIISGWPASLRLSLPYRVTNSNHIVEPQGFAAARWTRSYLGEGNRMAADLTNGLFLLAEAEQIILTGKAHGVQDMIRSESIGRSEKNVIHALDLNYIVVDRRLESWDAMMGLYFDTLTAHQELSPGAIQKFDSSPNVSRILDTGDIAIYDVNEIQQDEANK